MTSFSSFLEHCASCTNSSSSDICGTAWKDAVVELVACYQDLDRLLQEAAGSEDTFTSLPEEDQPCHTEAWQSLSVDSIVAVVHQRAAASSNPLSLTVASICASKVKDIITATNEDGALRLLLDKQTKAKVDVFLQVIARLQQDQAFSTKVFIKILNKQISLPIGLVWRLHKSGVMPLDAYIACNLSRPAVIGSLATDIARLCEKGEEDSLPHRRTIVSDFIGYLVQHGYQTPPSDDATARGMKKVSCALLDSIAKKVLSEDSERDIALHSLPYTTSAEAHPRMLKAFFTRTLSVILSLNPLLKVSEALTMQHQWTYSRTPSYLTDVYKQLLSVFDAREAVDILQNVLEVQEVNWQAVLSFTASLLVCFPDAPALLQELISVQLSQAFETSQLDGMIIAFLLARQGCLEGAQVFPAYQHWFQITFGNPATSPASSKKTFAFLIKFLTDVVPFETALYLKAHLLSPPCVPAKCRVILSDYISLVKTRLSDLGESMEELGIYEEGQGMQANVSDRAKAPSLAEQDLDKALSTFNKTGKVPASVMEASIFRKPYFVGRFLPSLLSPRPLPDVPDIRMKFIEALYNSDKITTHLYQKYTTTCAQLSAQLLEGVCELDDEMDDILLPPLEQLQHSLDGLEHLVQLTDGATVHNTCGGVTGQIALVSEKIHTCLGTEPLRNVITPLPLDIDLDSLDVDTLTLKVTDILLNSICHIVVTPGRHGNRQCQGHPGKGQWLSQLLVMLTDHRPVMATFCQRLCDLLTRQGPALESYHVKSLAVILIHIATVPQLHKSLTVKSTTPSLRLKTSTQCPPHGSVLVDPPPGLSTTQTDPQMHRDTGMNFLIEELFQSIPCFNAEWMEFVLRLTTRCLEYACTSFNGVTLHSGEEGQAVVPATLVKMFAFIVQRLCLMVRLPWSLDVDKTRQFGAALYQSDVFQGLLKDCTVSLQDWAEREIQISSCDDCLSPTDRQDYYDWTIQQWLVVTERGSDVSTRECATVLLNVILDFDASTHGSPSFVTACQNRIQHGCVSSLTKEAFCQGNGRSEMLLLLQRLMTNLAYENTSSVGDKQPWLVAVFHERLAQLIEDKQSAEQNETVNFFRLIRCLPAHLLFTILPPGGAVPRGHLGAVLDLVNSHFRNHLCDDAGCCLDLSTTLYLLQGLTALAAYSSCDVDGFIKDCPLFISSVVWHWPNLTSYMPKCSPEGSAIQRLLLRVKKIHEVTTSGSIDTSFGNEDSWILGVDLGAVYHRECGGEAAQQLERLILNICAQKTSLKQHQVADILRSFQECALSSLTRELLLENSLTSHMSHLLLQLWLDMPHLMTSLPCGHQMAVFTLVSPDCVQSLRPVTCMSVLVKSSTDQLARMTAQGDHLMSVLLPVYNECCMLHDQTSHHGTLHDQTSHHGALHDQTSHHGALHDQTLHHGALYDQTSHRGALLSHSPVVNLKFMLNAAEFVRKTLSRVHPSTLQRLDRNLLESCDQEVKNMIKHFATR